MKFIILSTILAFGLVSARPSFEERSIPAWHPPTRGDLRSPCPGLNTLANHGLLPRDGNNLRRAVVVDALKTGYNFDDALANGLFETGLTTNPEPNATWFSLEHLNTHGIIEHDASLSRADAYTGNNHAFNPSIFAQTSKYWTGATLTPTTMAYARIARELDSKVFNPEYAFDASREIQAWGESAIFTAALGNIQEGTADKNIVEYFFKKERLPVALGWKKQAVPVQNSDLAHITNLIGNVTGSVPVLLTPSENPLRSRGLHGLGV
ncbi:Cloroperoxidase [Trematosphaeria pertusa]|uniref:Cloroperoxidase n=1 Tax=Trematosphaeria pertusa TaxID=390896 RepID=A0A6A6IB74_9PLEO|nr:Cloroperoxidase [Trematosphaeria pertusa]KAF2246790.1 Cloroperoxidase [Trematosphaeria pertusa]